MTSEFYCSSVRSADGALWAVAIDLSRNADEPEALDLASINVVVTDGARAWRREGLTELDMGTVILNRMRHALEALVDFSEAPSEEYSVRLTPQAAGAAGAAPAAPPLLVEVEWDNRRHGKDLVYRVHFELDPAPDPAAAVRWALGGAAGAAAALQAEASRLEASCAALAAEAEAENKTLEEYAARKEELDGDLALKAAALLAAKQERLAEVLREADAAEEAARMAGAEPMGD